MITSDTYWIVLIMSTAIAVTLAISMNESLHKEFPHVKPYKWGYFTGWAGVIGGLAYSIVSFINAMKASPYGDQKPFLFFLSAYFVVAMAAHVFVIKRNRWGWVISIILQLNPLLWIINGIYLKNRWDEMSGGTSNIIEGFNRLGSFFGRLSLPLRSLIAGSVFWAIVVLAFVYMFNPYGTYIDKREQWQIIKIMIIPPALCVFGYYLFKTVAKQR